MRAAQSCAMNRHVKQGGTNLVDPDAVEKLLINMADFEHALENDVKPVCSVTVHGFSLRD